MNIKFEKLVRVDGQKADGSTWIAYKIAGNRLDGKGHWESGNIFDNKYNSKLLEQLNEFEEGDRIAVSHEKTDQGFWKITGVKEMTEDEVEAAANPPQGGSGTKGNGYTSGSKWNGRTGEAYDRSASIYLAYDMMKDTMKDTELKKLTYMEAFAKAVELAEMINEYIHSGDVVTVIAKDDEDALTPPNV